MAIITKGDLNSLVGSSYKSAEKTARFSEADRSKTYDIFLSHSFLDKDTIEKIHFLLEDRLKLTTYVDWIESPDLSRSRVTPATAATLRSVMRRCRSLIYAISPKSHESKWMPWELGYSDALHQRVAIMPIADYTATLSAYKDQEFIALYPNIDIAPKKIGPEKYLWVNDPTNSNQYALIHDWVKSGQLKIHLEG